jgi:hypothetical protein
VTYQTVNYKSTLAKLMASEDITILHEKIRTAYWDSLNRTLHCPIFENTSSELYDLFMGHEVGHCLFTPPAGWHDAVHNFCEKKHEHSVDCWGKKYHFFLNVCEDVRIERLIKGKFPGLKSSFTKGYRELYDRNFFGVKGLKSFEKLRLIDRINLHYKIGFQLRISFTDKEKVYLDRLDSANTFEEVEKIANDLYNLAKQEKESIKNKEELQKQIKKDGSTPLPRPDPTESSENDSQETDGSESEKSNKSIDESEDDEDSEESGSVEDESSSETLDETTKSDTKDLEDEDKESRPKIDGDENDSDEESENEPSSLTDEAFRENEKTLANDNINKIANLTLPVANLNTIVISLDKIVSEFEFEMTSKNRFYALNAEACLKFFRQKNSEYIRLLLQEFQMQKNATQFRREDTYRSGELDTRRLSQYRLTNDIFKRMTEVPKGKNHGMIKVIDMSGSMNGISIYNAIEQALILAMFCDGAQIPYEVYGFADSHKTNNSGFSRNDRDMILSFVRLRTLLDSKASPSLRRKSMAMLAYFAVSHYMQRNSKTFLGIKIKSMVNGEIDTDSSCLDLNETPLIETIVAMRSVIERFKAVSQVDIINVIYLTDGDGNSEVGFPTIVKDDLTRQIGGSTYCNWIITDPKTLHSIFIENTHKTSLQTALLTFVQQLTSCRHIGFYICDPTKMIQKANTDEDKSQAKKYGFVSVKTSGFDTYYFISNEFMNSTEMVSQDASLETFNSEQNRKKAARVILSQFAKEIGQRL